MIPRRSNIPGIRNVSSWRGIPNIFTEVSWAVVADIKDCISEIEPVKRRTASAGNPRLPNPCLTELSSAWVAQPR